MEFSKEKQVEEMVKAIYNLDHCEGYKDDRGCMYAPSCSVCKYGRENKAKQISELLTKQGYRKSTDVAREIFEEIEKLMNEVYSSVQYGCYSYGMTKHTDSPSAQRQCGKLEGVKYLGDRLAELKKKYTQEK